MSAAGRVCTGFSLPYVATYVNNSGTISYTSGQKLARGVDVSIEPSASDNVFHADNVEAEVANQFTGGSFTLTVDGLLPAAEKLIMGLPAISTGASWYIYDDDRTSGFFGLGFIARYMSDGVTSYVPYVLAKVAFDPLNTSAATQEEEINWQTQSITGQIMRAEDAKHTWKYVGTEYSTEAAAEAALKTKLGISNG